MDCVSVTPVSHRRKRRFPERELLERVRKYEELLKINGIDFDPLHPKPESCLEEKDAISEGDDENNDERDDGFGGFSEAKYASFNKRESIRRLIITETSGAKL